MMGRAHTGVVVNAARINNGRYAEILSKEQFWTDNFVAARLNDGILNDWIYTNLPLSILVIHRLTEEILSIGQADSSKVAFLINWISHYISDSLWVNHAYVRDSLPTIKAEGMSRISQFDNSIEIQIETLIANEDYFPVKIEPWDRGFWNSFWSVLTFVEREKENYYSIWKKGGDYLSFAKKNIILVIKVFENYLRYLDLSDRIGSPSGRREMRPIRRVYCSKPNRTEILYAILLHTIVDGNCKALDDIFTEDRDIADLIVEECPKPEIDIEGGRIFLRGDQKTLGAVVDHYIFTKNISFGLPKATKIHPAWPGNYILESKMSGRELEDTIFTETAFCNFQEYRGYENFEIIFGSSKLAPKAKEMREGWLTANKGWIEKWSKFLLIGAKSC